jgi:hypothetical protein
MAVLESRADALRVGASTICTTSLKLDDAVHEFQRRAGPWARARESRLRKAKAVDAPGEQPGTRCSHKSSIG